MTRVLNVVVGDFYVVDQLAISSLMRRLLKYERMSCVFQNVSIVELSNWRVVCYFFLHLFIISPTRCDIDVRDLDKATTESNLGGECRGWCTDHAHPWSTKCQWKGICDTCAECSGELHYE